jgi:VanZ family protein
MIKEISKEKIFYLIMTLIIAIVIFYASNIKSTAEATLSNFSVIYHFGVFFLFSFFLFLTIKKEKTNLKTVLIVFLISIVYAFLDEIHQLFVLGRFANIKNILIDGIGSLAAIFLVSQIERFSKFKIQKNLKNVCKA